MHRRSRPESKTGPGISPRRRTTIDSEFGPRFSASPRLKAKFRSRKALTARDDPAAERSRLFCFQPTQGFFRRLDALQREFSGLDQLVHHRLHLAAEQAKKFVN